jgi:hypothetical protein
MTQFSRCIGIDYSSCGETLESTCKGIRVHISAGSAFSRAEKNFRQYKSSTNFLGSDISGWTIRRIGLAPQVEVKSTYSSVLHRLQKSTEHQCLCGKCVS